MSTEFFQRLKTSNRLPSPPGVALRVLELARSDDASLDDLAKTISSDPALASRILKFANSPVAGLGRSVASLDEAASFMGLRSVQLVALSFSLITSGKAQGNTNVDLGQFWPRSLACATAAKILAKTAGRIDPNEAFITGLLLHIGQLALACAAADVYEPVLRDAAAQRSDLLALEKERLGVNHIEASAWLLQEWKLPESLWQAIAGVQAAKTEAADSGRVSLSRVLCVADVTASLLCDAAAEQPGRIDEVLRLVSESFELDEAGWVELYNEIVQEWTAYGQLLSLKTGTEKSFRDLQDEAREHIAMLTAATQLENARMREENESLRQQTRIDGLTRVNNRASFDERLASEIERARRVQRPLVLFLLDIDHFKKFNDTYGHQVGDQVLQAVAKALDDSIRKMDFVARYGGEEFAVIAPECSPQSASSLAERLRGAVSEIQLQANGQDLRVTTSVGVAFALWPGHARTEAELIAAADACLYEAKRGGRNCCRFETALRPAA